VDEDNWAGLLSVFWDCHWPTWRVVYWDAEMWRNVDITDRVPPEGWVS
jgi:hypothetical protein